MSCNRNKCTEGEGDNFEDARNTPPFHTIITEIPMNMFLVHDTNLSNGIVTISAQDNVQEKISLDVSNKILRIYFNDCLDGHSDIDLSIQSAEFERIIASSPVKIFTERAILSDSLYIETLKATNGDIFFAGRYLQTDFKASGRFDLHGFAQHFICNTTANIELKAYSFVADTIDLKTNSIEDAELYGYQLIKAQIDGSGDVYYKGFPDTEVSGDGSGQLIENN